MLSLFAVMILAMAPAPLQASTGASGTIVDCVSGQRIIADTDAGFMHGTVVGAGRSAETCLFQFDERLQSGVIDGEKIYARPSTDEPPAGRMVQLGGNRSHSPSERQELLGMAHMSAANARVFASLYPLGPHDGPIATLICGQPGQQTLCARVTAEVNQAADSHRRALATAAPSAPPASAYAGSSAQDWSPTAPAASPTYGAPVAVQSESAIREGQARCRAGSGPC